MLTLFSNSPTIVICAAKNKYSWWLMVLPQSVLKRRKKWFVKWLLSEKNIYIYSKVKTSSRKNRRNTNQVQLNKETKGKTLKDDKMRNDPNDNMMKRPLTLDLNKKIVNTNNGPPILSTPDVNLCKLGSPELENLILNTDTLQTPTPSAMFPSAKVNNTLLGHKCLFTNRFLCSRRSQPNKKIMRKDLRMPWRRYTTTNQSRSKHRQPWARTQWAAVKSLMLMPRIQICWCKLKKSHNHFSHRAHKWVQLIWRAKKELNLNERDNAIELQPRSAGNESLVRFIKATLLI